jgi:riboflavin transporter FmnP
MITTFNMTTNAITTHTTGVTMRAIFFARLAAAFAFSRARASSCSRFLRNASALAFTFLQLIHLTILNYCDWLPLMISGIIFGASCIVMVITSNKGVMKWVL